MRVRRGPTERGKGVQYIINVEFVKFNERWNFTGRLRRVELDALLYREGFEKPTGYIQRIRWERYPTRWRHEHTSRTLQPRTSALPTERQMPQYSDMVQLPGVVEGELLPTLYSSRMPSRT